MVIHGKGMGTSSLLVMITNRFGYVYRKSDSYDRFSEFKVELDNLSSKHI